MNTYKDLVVYQKSLIFVVGIYKVLAGFPKTEAYGLTDQIKRAAVSIPSNIAEGFDRRSQKEYSHFLRVAYGSSAEIETQLLISYRLGYMDKDPYVKLLEAVIEIRKMLHKLIIVIGAGS